MVEVRQYSGSNTSMFCSPTVTGQFTLAVFKPALRAADQSVGTRMSSAYQYQPSRLTFSASNVVLETMPCCAGSTPVTRVVWLGYVTVGVTAMTPEAYAPWSTKARRFG